jgi:hypothetical protein
MRDSDDAMIAIGTRTLAVGVVCLVAACSGDATRPSSTAQIAGEYTLQTIDGQPLPYTLVEVAGGYLLQQVSGTMTLNANRTFIEQALLRETINTIGGPVVSDTIIVLDGSWEAEDSVIVLTSQRDGSVLFGTANGGRLTLHFEGNDAQLVTYFYRLD